MLKVNKRPSKVRIIFFGVEFLLIVGLVLTLMLNTLENKIYYTWFFINLFLTILLPAVEFISFAFREALEEEYTTSKYQVIFVAMWMFLGVFLSYIVDHLPTKDNLGIIWLAYIGSLVTIIIPIIVVGIYKKKTIKEKTNKTK